MSSTTRSATPTASASSTSCSGSSPPSRVTIGSGMCTPAGVLGTRLARLKCVQTHPGDDRREPSAEILDPIGSRAADAQPRILNSIIGFRQRPQHPIGNRPQVRPVFLEAFSKPVAFVHAFPDSALT